MGDNSRKIALITAHGWVGVSTPVVMTARYLAQTGYEVDLFIDEDEHCRDLGIDIPVFKESGIRIVTFSRKVPQHVNVENLQGIDPVDLLFVESVGTLPGAYAWLVGYEPHGLIRTALLAEKWHIPFIYHSLEIYDLEDNLKRLEQLFSQQALLTVTQDNVRADILAHLNHIARDRVTVVYNSSLGEIMPDKKNYFRAKFALPAESVVVLATGTLLPITCIDSLIRYAPLWPPEFVLVLHGWIPDTAFKDILHRECAAHPNRIFLSTDIIPADKKSIVFQSADIGLAFYRADDTNLTYAAGSAGKIYDFMQAGIPVIANDILGMRDLVEGNGIGVVVPDASAIASMLPFVVNNYKHMHESALGSFAKYSFEGSYNALIAKIQQQLTAPASCVSLHEGGLVAYAEINSESIIPQIQELMRQAISELEANNAPSALNCVIKAKALRKPVLGLDYIRAICFMRLGRNHEAFESVKEELRSFPENPDALQLLSQMQPGFLPALTGSDEFHRIVSVIAPYTMLSEQRLYSLYTLARAVCEKNIPGNFVECGVAAGGSSALLAFVIRRYSKTPRKIFSCDSFSGMPAPGIHDTHESMLADATGWGTGTCSAPVDSLLEICNKLGVADLVVPVKGFFEETLPVMRDWMGMIALLHLDGDWYESTKCILDNLYDRLVNDAVLQVDDYGYWDGCRKALHEFEPKHNVLFTINEIDGTGVWFSKPKPFEINPQLPISQINEFKVVDPVAYGIESQMSANERFQLYYVIRNLLSKSTQLKRFIEIGSFAGGSFFEICMTFQRMGGAYQGIAVEPGGQPQFHDVMKKFSNNAVHLPMYSHEAAQRLALMLDQGSKPEFILIDGDHGYQGVRQDIIDYYPLLAPGGIMMFHDYLPPLNDRNREFIYAHHANTEPGIRQACHEVMELTYGLEPLDLPLPYPDDPTQTQAHLPIIPGVYSTIRAYRKPC